MVWFEITAIDGMKHLINVNHVFDVTYNPTTDVTYIKMNKANGETITMRGNKEIEISRIISRNDKCDLHRIGD